MCHLVDADGGGDNERLVLARRRIADGIADPDGKAAWAIGMLIVPFIGLLIYTMLRPGDSQIAKRRRS